MNQLEQTAREALAITAGLRKYLPEANDVTADIDKLNALAQGYLDLLVENKMIRLDRQGMGRLLEKSVCIPTEEYISITQLKSELESVKSGKGIANPYIVKNNLIKKLQSDRAKLVEALKFECGNRCNAELNPCNARAVLAELGES